MLFVIFACVFPAFARTDSLSQERSLHHDAYQVAAPSGTKAEELRNYGKDPSKRAYERSTNNERIFLWVNSHHSAIADRFFLLYRYLGSGWIVLPVFVFVILRRRYLTLPLFIALTLESLMVVTIKHLFEQPRPALIFGTNHIHLLLPLFKESFPSGDTALAFVLAGVMQYGQRWWGKALWMLYAVLIGYERMYLGVHFPIDVLTGALIGILSSMATLAFMKEWLRKQQGLPKNMPTVVL